MKEKSDWSSERRGSTKFGGGSIIPEWASLPPELVERIADRALSTTGGIDAYTDMRAVCSTWRSAIPCWRSAIAKASPLAAVTDLRFRPRNWIMVDLKSKDHDDDACLFLHVPTGRFRRRRLPVLRDNILVGATDGLLVLGDREPPHLARVLNPFTGDMLHFPELLSEEFGPADVFRTALSGGPNSTLVLWRDKEWRWHTVMYADPTSAEFTEEEIGLSSINSMVTFQGDIYYAGLDGCVFKFVAPAEQRDHEPWPLVITQMSLHMDIYLERDEDALSYLVESAGELLLVRRRRAKTLKVFRVDVEHKLLEEVKSIGGCRALFLGRERCVSVDADKLPSVDSDCIYMFIFVETWGFRGHAMHMYNLRDGTMKIISNEPRLCANNHQKRSFHEDPWDYSPRSANDHHQYPLSLIQVLLDYCNDITEF